MILAFTLYCLTTHSPAWITARNLLACDLRREVAAGRRTNGRRK